MNDSTGQWVIEWGKLALLALALLGGLACTLCALFLLPADDARFAPALAFGTGTVGSVIGYVTGNGRLAAKGQPTVAAIARKLTDEQPTTSDPATRPW